MEVSFVLVEPAVPENIGAAARALKTMGFMDLRLVSPAHHLANEAKWLAHGSTELLEKAKVFDHFKDAIQDLDFIIGTTSKKRSIKYDYYSPEEAREIVQQKIGIISKVGIVFGREESGLKNEELSSCDIASTIVLSQPFPSINLAQSVMLYAYIFSKLILANRTRGEATMGNNRLYRELKLSSTHILQKLKIDKGSNLHHRMMERIAASNEDDSRLFLSFAKKFKQEFE